MKANWIVIAIILLVVIIGAVTLLFFKPAMLPTGGVGNSAFDKSVSDGVITVKYPAQDLGLAVNQSQILVHPYTPPCSSDFVYCFYYNGAAYEGTNFESAGLRIQKRNDLGSERQCLDTPPEGYSAGMKPEATTSSDAYAMSAFPVGDAGAGHVATGDLYRLYYREHSLCYEFETRVAHSQFANYPAGSVKEFTSADEANVFARFTQILDNMSLPNGEKFVLPVKI